MKTILGIAALAAVGYGAYWYFTKDASAAAPTTPEDKIRVKAPVKIQQSTIDRLKNIPVGTINYGNPAMQQYGGFTSEGSGSGFGSEGYHLR